MMWSSKSKEWIEEIQNIHRMLIRDTVSPFEDKSLELKQYRIDRARADHKFFFKTYLPQFFVNRFCKFHDDLIFLMEKRDRSFSVVAGPKKHAKSTIRMGYMIHQGCFGLRSFEMLTSQNEDFSIGHLIPIKVQYEENPRILEDFGQLRKEGMWEVESFALLTGTFHLARGIDQPHRGLLWFEHPPDLICGDDIENKRNTRNPKLCNERVERIKEEVYDSLDLDGTFVWFGNWIRNHSALAQLIRESEKNQEISGSVYQSQDEKGRLLWPGHYTKKKLNKIKKIMGSVSYNREYMNRDAEAGQDFPEDKAKYYESGEIANLKGPVVTYGDPAGKGIRAGQSYHTWITLMYHKKSGIFYCLNAWIKHTPFMRWIDAWFMIFQEFGGRGYFEAVGAQVNYKENFKPSANEMGLPAPLPRDVRKNKMDRIVDTLSPLWENGRLRFRKGHSDQDKLVDQFIFFGQTGVEIDGPDATEGAVRNMKKSGNYVSVIEFGEEEDLNE